MPLSHTSSPDYPGKAVQFHRYLSRIDIYIWTRRLKPLNTRQEWQRPNRSSRCSSSHVQGDQEQFLSIALQVAAGEARSGRKDTADQLAPTGPDRSQRERPIGLRPRRRMPRAIPIARPRGELQTLLSTHVSQAMSSQMVLDKATVKRLTGSPQATDAARLAAPAREGAERSRLLLAGPAGSGKTMTCSGHRRRSCTSRYSPFGWTR